MRTDNFAKIGITSGDIKRRISQIQTGTPTKIYFVEYYRVSTRRDALNIESHLHERLSRRRTYGEWFKNVREYSKELTSALSEVGLHREDANIVNLGKNDFKNMTDELRIISNNIDKYFKNKELDKLINIGHKLSKNKTVLNVKEIEDKYRKSLHILGKEESIFDDGVRL